MIITPGDYRTRDGRKATVAAIDTQAAIYHNAIGWLEGGVESWSTDGRYLSATEDNAYDLVEPWLDPVPWDWSSTCPWFNYLAMDESGEWFLYNNEPSLDTRVYIVTGYHCKIPEDHYPKWSGDWTKSLTKRS